MPYVEKIQETTKPYTDKIQETTKPYTDKIQETAKPYTDAAGAKAHELLEKIEGTAPPSLTSEKSVGPTPTSGASPLTDPSVASEKIGDVAGSVGEKAKGIFEQVSNTITQLTHTIDEKTKSESHPGIITQAAAAIEKGVAKVDEFFDHVGETTAPVVQTTTNSVPHTEGQ